jgi:hypothetical protein
MFTHSGAFSAVFCIGQVNAASVVTDTTDYRLVQQSQLQELDFPLENVTVQVTHADGLRQVAGHDPWTIR